ncbi:MAG TPA: FtsX-like permease family protein, partial [Bdellovibrionota bacterium]|nr:FtsX-like permease family protein [Bdellovibrionota bacterium]
DFDEVPGGRELAALDCQSPGATAKIRSDADIQLVGRTFTGDLGALDGEIMGHYSTGLALSEDSGLTAPLALLQRLHDTDAVTYVSVYLRDVGETQALAGELAAKLKEKSLPIEIHTYREEAISLFYVGVVGFLLTMAAFFIFLVATVVSLSIVNALTMSVLERTREIGTLRSIGFSPRRVAGIFVRESFVLGALSLAAGIATAYLVTAIVNRAGIRFTPPGIAGTMPFLLVPTPALCAGIAGFLSIIIVIASFKTTVRRTRMSAAKLLVEATG